MALQHFLHFVCLSKISVFAISPNTCALVHLDVPLALYSLFSFVSFSFNIFYIPYHLISYKFKDNIIWYLLSFDCSFFIDVCSFLFAKYFYSFSLPVTQCVLLAYRFYWREMIKTIFLWVLYSLSFHSFLCAIYISNVSFLF